MLGVIAAGPAFWARLRQTAPTAAGGTPLEAAQLLAPIPRPRRNVFCVSVRDVQRRHGGQWFKGKNEVRLAPPRHRGRIVHNALVESKPAPWGDRP